MLGSRPLAVPDEGRYSEIPREMVATGDYITPRLNGVKYFEKPVLFYWLQSVSILATMTKGLIGILIPVMVIGVWIWVLNDWRILKTIYLPSGLVLFLVACAPWHILVNQANPEFLKYYFIHEHVLRYLTRIHKRYEPDWFFIPILLLGLFPWTVFLAQSIRHSLPASWRERHEHRDALFLMLWAGLVFIFFSASSSKLIPYILPVFPPLAVLIGRYLAEALEMRDMPGIRSGYVILLVTALALGAALMAEIHHLIPPETPQLLVYIRAMALILILGALLTGVLARRGLGVPMVFASVIISTVLFLTVLNAGSVFYGRNSVKDLALVLKPRLQAGDEVVSYHGYYQDLPVYLERSVTVAGWTGELEFGTEVEDDSRWMIKEGTFWRRWKSPDTLYMLTRREIYNGLLHDGRGSFYLIAQTAENVLLCNKKIRP